MDRTQKHETDYQSHMQKMKVTRQVVWDKQNIVYEKHLTELKLQCTYKAYTYTENGNTKVIEDKGQLIFTIPNGTELFDTIMELVFLE